VEFQAIKANFKVTGESEKAGAEFRSENDDQSDSCFKLASSSGLLSSNIHRGFQAYIREILETKLGPKNFAKSSSSCINPKQAGALGLGILAGTDQYGCYLPPHES
jgi:hypothetical protein